MLFSIFKKELKDINKAEIKVVNRSLEIAELKQEVMPMI